MIIIIKTNYEVRLHNLILILIKSLTKFINNYYELNNFLYKYREALFGWMHVWWSHNYE